LISRSNKQQNEERFHAICLGDLIASDKLRKEGEKYYEIKDRARSGI